jgi:hypothetical protein
MVSAGYVRIWKEKVVSFFKVLPSTPLNRKNTGNLGRESRWPAETERGAIRVQVSSVTGAPTCRVNNSSYIYISPHTFHLRTVDLCVKEKTNNREHALKHTLWAENLIFFEGLHQVVFKTARSISKYVYKLHVTQRHKIVPFFVITPQYFAQSPCTLHKFLKL